MKIETTPVRRAGFAASCACLLAAVALSAGAPPRAAAAADCPNEGIRRQQGVTYLPACRAYEMVSPKDKAGYDIGLPISAASTESTAVLTDGIDFTAADAQATPDGDKVTFKSVGGFAGIQSSTAGTDTYIAERGADGWTTKGASLPFLKESPGLSLTTYPIPYAFTEDLSKLVAITPEAQRLSPDERRHDNNIYTRDNLTGALTLRTPEYIPDSTFDRVLSGYESASADLSHITFFTTSDVLPDVPGGILRVYESYLGADGESHLRVVSKLPNGELAPEASSVGGLREVAANRASDLSENSISRDGSRIVWFESNVLLQGGGCGWPGQLESLGIRSYDCPTHVFLREDGTTTRDVATPAPGTPADPSPGPGELFWGATPDVGSVFFTAQRNLTPDANADDDANLDTGSYGDLYRYRPEADGGAGELVDVTPDAISPAGAQVLGVLAVSESGDRVYFVARSNRLDGERGVQGEANLYLWSDVGGTPRTTFVATLAAPTESSVGDIRNWLRGYQREAMATPSGGDLVFSSRLPAAGVETAGTKQVYRYDAASDTVTCVSCPGSGVPSADAQLPGPGRVPFIDHHPRAMTTDGRRVFFETAEALSPLDGNGVIDVYEWNAETGSAAMLSDGSGADPSFLEDVTPDGSDVFIATRAALVGADVDRNVDLYDVRAGGGFPEASPPAGCVGGACKEPREAAPRSATLGSTTVTGVAKAAHGAGCAQPRRQAAKLDRRAKHLRKQAGGAGSRRAATMRRKARGLEAQAKGLKDRAKRCDNTMRGVAR